MPIVGVGGQLRELPKALEAPCVIVCTQPLQVLQAAAEQLEDHDGWQWSVIDSSDSAGSPQSSEHTYTTSRQVVAVRDFGWPGSRWKVIAPSGWFAGLADRRWTAGKLAAWGEDLAGWCADNDLPLTTSRGGMGGRLLRDARWFPAPRRIVPQAINDVAREHLPGNFYQIVYERAKRAIYYDQASAHHQHALGEDLPDPDELHPAGDYRGRGRPWVGDPTGRVGKRVLAGHGLLWADLDCPSVDPGRFPPPWFASGPQWIFSNELGLLQELGGKITCIRAAWTSPHPWTGIARYAAWAMDALSTASPERRLWLKPTLLAAYGVLASRPRLPAIRHQGTGSIVHLVNGMVGVQRQVASQSPVAHVLARGMIEAATRRESLALARELGPATVGIYSDAVIASSRPTAASPSPPGALWRQKTQLTNFAYVDKKAMWYTADEETKHPGQAAG